MTSNYAMTIDPTYSFLTILKRSEKTYELISFEKYIYSESLLNTLYNEIKYKLYKNFFRTK